MSIPAAQTFGPEKHGGGCTSGLFVCMAAPFTMCLNGLKQCGRLRPKTDRSSHEKSKSPVRVDSEDSSASRSPVRELHMGGAPKLSDVDPTHDQGLVTQQRMLIDKEWELQQPSSVSPAFSPTEKKFLG